MRTRQTILITLAAVGVFGAAGCGGAGTEAGKPPAQILRDAQAAAQAADSVHISGTVVRGAGSATIDLVLTAAGDGREQITGADQRVDLIKVGSTLYVKGLTAPGSTGAGYQRLAANDPRAAQLSAQLDKDAVFAQLIKQGDTPRVTGTETVAGQAAVALTPGAGAGVLYVADDAAHPYPLEVHAAPPAATAAQPGPSGALTFTEWNAHAVISPPNGS